MKYLVLLMGSAALLVGAACTTSVTTAGGSGTGGSGGAGSGGNGTGAGGGDVTGCMEHADCIVVSKSCCGSCGAATRGDAFAISLDGVDAYRMKACEGTDGCPACYSPSDPTLLAICKTGKCQLLDLQKDDSTACTLDGDCRLRSKDCCECGGGTDMESLIAIHVNAEADYTSLVCDGDIGCPECAPVYPVEASAACNPGGYCEVVWN